MPQQPPKPPKSPFDIASEALTAARNAAGVPNFSPTPAPAGATFTPPTVTGPVVVGGYEGPAQTPGGLVGPSDRDIGIARQQAIAQDALPGGGFEASPEQGVQRVGPGPGTETGNSFQWQWGNAWNAPVQDISNPGQMPDMSYWGKPGAGPNPDPATGVTPPGDVGAYLDDYYRRTPTPEAVKQDILDDFKESYEANNRYWRTIANQSGSPTAVTDTMQAQYDDANRYMQDPKGYKPPDPVWDRVTNQWVLPNDPAAYDSRPGIQGTNIVQPDGRTDQYRPGVGYAGSIFSGASLETARDIYARQTAPTPQTGTLPGPVGQDGKPTTVTVPIDPKPAQAQQVPLPGGGTATTPTAPMPENVSRVITAPSGQVIGWARQWGSPEAAQRASDAANRPPAPASTPAPNTLPPAPASTPAPNTLPPAPASDPRKPKGQAT